MAIEYSPEQKKVLEAKEGGYIVVANAGTGKTTSIAELITISYLSLQERMFRGQGHVGGKQQEKLLRQFLCVTFTVKAATELDEKLKKLFAQRGIPIPVGYNGGGYRIARTLDSLVSQWLRSKEVFRAWMAMEEDTHRRLIEVADSIQPSLLIRLGINDREIESLHQMAKAWPWLADEQTQAMLLDTVIRHHFCATLPGCDIEEWAYDFDLKIPEMKVAERGLETDFWEAPLDTWQKHQSGFRDDDRAIKQGKKLEGVDGDKQQARVHEWERMQAAKEEFLSVNELARARGYHPVYAPERLLCRSVELQLAAGDHINSYRTFIDLSKQWHTVKTNFLIREFGDQTSAFVRACESHPELLERTSEFPRLIRRKYVFWDEVQDNSDFQHRILKLFYGKGVPYLSVAIGDPKQQIYCWRGASPRGFLDMIEKKRSSDPNKLLGLTISFRSAKKIVEMGNEIIQTLPTYRDTVLPSSTIYEEEGIVEITRPFSSVDEEAEWCRERIQHYMDNTKSRVMIVSRSDISDHPLYFKYLKGNPNFNSRISCLTIHKSKGLESDVVIVLGMVSGRIPDCRSNADEEVNLFYVACTRAKHTLILSGLVCRREINEAGRVEDKTVGPSPYFWKLPTLRSIALTAGWPESLLRQGVESDNQQLAMHLSRISKRKDALELERYNLFKNIGLPDDMRDASKDYGAVPALNSVGEMPIRKLDHGGNGKSVPKQAHDRVLKKLVEAGRMSGNVPRLQTDEFSVALRCKWIYKPEGSRYFKLSPGLMEIAKNLGVIT